MVTGLSECNSTAKFMSQRAQDKEAHLENTHLRYTWTPCRELHSQERQRIPK